MLFENNNKICFPFDLRFANFEEPTIDQRHNRVNSFVKTTLNKKCMLISIQLFMTQSPHYARYSWKTEVNESMSSKRVEITIQTTDIVFHK